MIKTNQNSTVKHTEYHLYPYIMKNVTYVPFYPPECTEALCRHYPDFIIIGGKKSGTGALWRFLSLHPSLVTNLANEETAYFFLRERHPKRLRHDKDYLLRMPLSKSNQLTYEKSIYFNPSRNSPFNIRQFCDRYNKTMKFILILREPVHRMISEYTRLKVRNVILKNHSLEYVLKHKGNSTVKNLIIDEGNYYAEMKRWLKYFSLKQFVILDGHELIKNPVKVLYKVESFLGVDHKLNKDIFYFDKAKGFFCYHVPKSKQRVLFGGTGKKIFRIVFKPGKGKTRNECLGHNKGRNHERQTKTFIRKWLDYYRPLNRMFFSLTGVYFNWTEVENKLLSESI